MPVYQDKERGTWYCSFYYTDWQGAKKKKTKRGFKLKREGQAFEREFLEKSQGSPKMTFASLVDLYLDDMKNRLRESTLETKENIISTKIMPCFGNMQIDKITPTNIRQWQNELISKGFADTYLKTIHIQISAIFNYAVKYYNLKANPCHKAESIGQSHAKEMNFWTRDEYERFASFIEDNPRWHVSFQVLYWTGLRVGELLALTRNDIDFEGRTITVSKSYQRIKKTDVITEPKTPKSNRVVAIPDFLCQELKTYISCLYGLHDKDRLFPVTKDYFYLKMKAGCKKAGIKRIRTHDLRHSHASLLIELGFSPLLIAERLGHENVETTLNTYSHLYPHKQEALAQKLEEIKPTVSK